MRLTKILTGLLLIVLLFASCKKRKEVKEWKKKEGIYQTETPYVLYEDSVKVIDAMEIQVISSGITCHGTSGIGVSFGVFYKSENPNPNYTYKCEYSSVSNYSFGSGGVTNTQIPFEQFTQGREFYLDFEGSELIFTIIKPDGTIDAVVYTKQ
ncbi:MAG: hypothetical protein KF704_01720 [Crocinitomicaceae bacterium]|nr:hypothetical protein [Crocinitomicaceae bacterium]NGF76787.1 hypothetical protein [Fluviicola sp. SGL-29]